MIFFFIVCSHRLRLNFVLFYQPWVNTSELIKDVTKISFLHCISALTGFVSSQEIFSLKKSYDSKVFIEGTDQVSIKQGMQLALSSLLVNLSGNSKIVDEKSIRIMMEAPEKYVTQYKLGSEDKKFMQVLFLKET